MIVRFGDKQYRLSTFPPLVGRELMVKGEGCNGLLEKDLSAWLPILSFVEVNILDDKWLRLSTAAMVENHVAPDYVTDLLLLQLQHNCKDVALLLNGPSVGDIVWSEIADILSQVFE